MEIIILLLFFIVIFIIFGISDDLVLTFFAFIVGLLLGLYLIQWVIDIDKIKEKGVKEYLANSKNYKIEIKYTQDSLGNYIPQDTTVTKLK